MYIYSGSIWLWGCGMFACHYNCAFIYYLCSLIEIVILMNFASLNLTYWRVCPCKSLSVVAQRRSGQKTEIRTIHRTMAIQSLILPGNIFVYINLSSFWLMWCSAGFLPFSYSFAFEHGLGIHVYESANLCYLFLSFLG